MDKLYASSIVYLIHLIVRKFNDLRMATAISVKNEKKELSCSICQDTFREMTISSCFHTFCQKCLDGHIRSSRGKTQYECPICNISITLSSDLLNSRRSMRYDTSIEIAYPDAKIWNDYCDICSGRVLAVNRCLQCNESFCENCTMVHMRMKASRYHGHRVVPLWGYDTKERFDDESQKFCPRHRNEEIIVVCKQCNILLCLICKHMEHENHVTRLISEEAEDVRRNLTDLLQSQMGMFESLQSKKEMLHTNKGHIARGLDNEIAKIRHQASKIQLEVEREKAHKERELIDHYETFHKNNVDSYEQVKGDNEEFISSSKKAQLLLDKNSDVHLVKEGPRVYERLNEMEQNRTPLNAGNPSKTFVPGEIKDGEIDRMLGHIGDRDRGHFRETDSQRHGSRLSPPAPSVTSGHTLPSIRASHVRNFQLSFRDGIGYIYGITPAGNDKAWITMLEHPIVTLVDVTGTVIDQVDVGETCDGVARDWHGGCFVSCPKSKSIKRIIVFGATKVDTIVDSLQEVPHGMSSIRSEAGTEELFVCCTDTTGSRVPIYDSNKGSVRVFTFLGQNVAKSFSLQAPVRIDVDSKRQLLCISDHSNGCVIVCDKTEEHVKSLYTGSDASDMLRPLGVCFDPFGGILIADWGSNAIRRITTEGVLIQNLLEDLDGPQAIAIDDSRQLWVGCKYGKVQVYKLE